MGTERHVAADAWRWRAPATKSRPQPSSGTAATRPSVQLQSAMAAVHTAYRHALSARRPGRAARPPASPPSPAPTASAAHAQARRTRLRTARVALAWSCRCTLWRRWCNAAGQWARRAAGAPLATRCASCSGAVDAAGGGEATAGGLAWPPFASGPGTSADLAGCSLDQQRVGSARCAVRRPTAHLLGVPAWAAQRSRQPHGGTRWDAVGRRGTVGRARRALFASARWGVNSERFFFSQLPHRVATDDRALGGTGPGSHWGLRHAPRWDCHIW